MSDEVITTNAAERRLAGQLMFTGVLLGAMFIAALFLAFLLYQASYAPNSTVATLTKEKGEIQAKLDKSTADLTAAQKSIETLTRDKADLQKQLDAKSGKKPAAPKPVDPFTR
jgi:hypothetical protein